MIATTATAAARSNGAASATIAEGASIAPGGERTLKVSPESGERLTFDRKPSLVEFVDSDAAETAGRLWWEHRDYQLRDGRRGAGIVGYQVDGNSLVAIPVFAPNGLQTP